MKTGPLSWSERLSVSFLGLYETLVARAQVADAPIAQLVRIDVMDDETIEVVCRAAWLDSPFGVRLSAGAEILPEYPCGGTPLRQIDPDDLALDLWLMLDEPFGTDEILDVDNRGVVWRRVLDD